MKKEKIVKLIVVSVLFLSFASLTAAQVVAIPAGGDIRCVTY